MHFPTDTSELAKTSPGIVAAPTGGPILPAIIAGAGEKAGKRFIEFLTATIRNGNTREAYARAIGDFFAWAARHRPPDTNRHRAGACRRLHRGVD